MRSFERGFGEEDSVVSDDSYGMAVDGAKACEEGGAVGGFEFGEVGAVDYAGDDFVHVYCLFEVCAHYAVEVCGVMERLLERGCLRGIRCFRIVEVGDAAAGEDQGVGVVNGEIVCYSRDFGMQFSAT